MAPTSRHTRLLLFILALLTVAGWATSCLKESVKTTYEKQETNIESFLASQLTSHPEYISVAKDGVEKLIITEGSGEELSSEGSVTLYYAGYVMTSSSISSSNLFATNSSTVAASSSWSLSEESAFEPVTLSLGEDDLVEGLRKGLPGVKAGEECYILFSGRYGFGTKKLGTIPANSAIAYHIWVESVDNSAAK